MRQNEQSMKNRPSKYKIHFRKWHRRLGFAAAIFILNLSVTGILLNHYQSLSLHESYIKSSLILNWYGIKAPQLANCQSVPDFEVCMIGEQSYINSHHWKDNGGELLLLEDMVMGVVLVTGNSVDWFTKDGQLIDSVSITDVVSSGAIAATISNDVIHIQTADGHYLWDDAAFNWKSSSDAVAFEEPLIKAINDNKLDFLQQEYRSRQITQLKFVQDLHSGAIFGLSGTVFTDISGLILIWLVLSGFLTWYRRRSKTVA